jgi:hypothetical protein
MNEHVNETEKNKNDSWNMLVSELVKPLVWKDIHYGGAKASAWFAASYLIHPSYMDEGCYELSASYPGCEIGILSFGRIHPSMESAKAAAQADYNMRMSSSIDIDKLKVMIDLITKKEREHCAQVANTYGATPGYPDGKTAAFRKHRGRIATEILERNNTCDPVETLAQLNLSSTKKMI